jgi:hypothetical protein
MYNSAALARYPDFFRFTENKDAANNQDTTNQDAAGDCTCDGWNCREEIVPEIMYLEQTQQRTDDIAVTVRVQVLVCPTQQPPKFPCEEELAAFKLHYGLLGTR